MKKIILSLTFTVIFSLLYQLKAQLSFSTSINYSVGTNPSSIISEDLNGDGNLDLAIANGTSNDLSILIGTGAGSFFDAVNYPVGSSPKSIVSGDFNNDGKKDLATANEGSNDVSVVFGLGSGTFSTATSYSAGMGARGITTKDFNGDGFLDLAVANNLAGNVSILFGSGTGSFALPINYPVGSSPWAITYSDFNGDGKSDLAVSNGGSNNVSVLLGLSAGTFSSAVNYAASTNPRALIARDLNSDGKMDLAVTNLSFNNVSILIGTGIGTFSAAVNYTVGGTFPISITSADYDLDGILDLSTSNTNSGNVSILKGSGLGTFSVVATYTTGTNAFSSIASDFNEDGKFDLAVANSGSNNMSVLLNTSLPLVPNSNFLISTSKCTGSNIIFTDKSTYAPTSWSWTFPAATPSVSTLQNPTVFYSSAGTYTATLIASNGIGAGTQFTQTFVVNATPNLSLSKVPPKCFLACDGEISSVVSGGNAPYTYSWAPSGNTSANQLGLCAGNYTATVSDVNNCIMSKTVSLVSPPILSSFINGNQTICEGGSTTLSANTSGGTGPYSYSWTPNVALNSTVDLNVNANPTANQAYSLSATDANGCNVVSSVTVNVNALPTLTISVSNSTLCAGNSTTLSVSGANTYTWSPGGLGGGIINVTPSSTTIYTVLGTNTLTGCKGTSISEISIVSNPTISAVTNQTAICTGNSATLSATGAISYTWNPGNLIGSDVVVNPTSTTIYTVIGSSGLCSDEKLVGLTVNLTPSNTAFLSASEICAGSSATVFANGSGANSFTWNPGSINGPSIVVNPSITTTYSLVSTNSLTSCSNLSSVTLTVNTTPTVSIDLGLGAGNSTICSGTTLTITTNALPTAAVNYTLSSITETLTGSTFTTAPLANETYTLVGESSSGCISGETSSLLTVNPTPTISVIGNTTICKGSTALLTASGATSYTWSSGVNTSSVSLTPTVTTTYTVTGENGNGCYNSFSITVSIIPNKNINGVVSSTIGGTSGEVILYKYTLGLSKWDSITTVPFSSSYSFADIDSALYVVRAIPTATNIQVTYGSNALSWKDATVINHGCAVNSIQNIDLVPLTQLTPGPGVFSGVIEQASGFGQRNSNSTFVSLFPGQPIGGIVVKGGRNPGGQMFVQTITNAAGEYTLAGIPLSSGTDDYFIMVDIPGLDTNGTYHRVISTGNSLFENLNFTVDSMYINPIGNVTSISTDESLLGHQIQIFPNPANDFVNLKYELNNTAHIQIEMYSILGEKVMMIEPSSIKEKNKYNHSIDLKALSSGIYFIKFKINDSEAIIKLIRSN